MPNVITDMFVSLVKNMSVIIVFTYILTRTKLYKEILEKRIKLYNQILLILIFGLFSII